MTEVYLKINQVYMGKEEWEEVVDFTKIRKGGIPAKELLSLLKAVIVAIEWESEKTYKDI